ncbi:MAG: hypothetical protein AAGD43_33530 [Pseudomonadota bacterium]
MTALHPLLKCLAVNLIAPCILVGMLVLASSEASPEDDPSTWPRGTLPVELLAPDLSFLNEKPAGTRGRILADGGDLVFADGTPARFWGTNLQAYALFHTTPKHIRAHAKRIAALGFNLVRLHHHDSKWVQPNIFGNKAPTTTQLHPPSQRQIDLWISALKAEGVYIWLDLHVGRQMTTLDVITDFHEIAKGEAAADIRGFNYISQTIQQHMLDFQDAYLRHVNTESGLTYAEDPAIVAVQITNENDLTHHFGNALLPDKGVPAHSALYMALAKQFAEQYRLDPEETWRSWEHGSPKIFLNDLEQRFNQKMIAGIRATGFSGLIATTSSWGGMSIAGLPSLTNGSIIDVHSYGTGGDLTADPHHTPGFLDWVAAAHINDMPLSVSEWNVSPFPVEDRFIAPLRMATSAAHQGWDAPMVYGYAQQPLNTVLKPSNWDIAGDPGIIAMMPAAAILYRQGHVRPAAITYALKLGARAFFDRKVTPKTSAALRTIVEQSRLLIELPKTSMLPWLNPKSAEAESTVIADPDMSFLSANASEIIADTGDFRRDFDRGLFTVDTPLSQIAAGHVGGEILRLSDIELAVETPLAAVAVQSMDGAPIQASRRIMISLAARVIPSGDGKLTYQLEPIQGQVRIRANPSLSLRQPGPKASNFSGAHSLEGAVHVIDLAEIGGAQWLVLE